MAVIRLPDHGGLWIWSPVAATNEIRRAVDALGPVRHLVAPNRLHHSFLGQWARAYPRARVQAAPGLTDEIAATAIHSTLGDEPNPAWAGVIDQVIVRGNRIATEAVFHHRASACVLVTDLVQQIPPGWFNGWRAVVARLDRMTAAVPSVPRKFPLATKDRAAFRDGVNRILDWPSDRLVMAHGAPIASGGRDRLRDAFGWSQR